MLYDLINGRQVTGAEKIEMNEQGIEVANIPLFVVISRKREVVMIRLIKDLVKSAKQCCHGEVHTAMSEINSRIDQYGHRSFAA